MSFFLVSLAAAIAVGLLRSLALFGSPRRAAAPVGPREEPASTSSPSGLAVKRAA